MEIKPLICPQCGGEIINYSPTATSAECGYCSTNFLIHKKEQAAIRQEAHGPAASLAAVPKLAAIIAVVVLSFVGVIFLISFYRTDKTPTSVEPAVAKAQTPRPKTSASPVETPNPNLFDFGGKGTGDGLFQDASSIAVDKQGRIYVADDTLRVQQFNENGEFIKTIQVPAKTANYERARTIDKIAVAQDGTLYIAVGGVILLYSENSTEPKRTVHAAPDYIQDFALRSDGSLLMISDNDRVETLIFTNKAGKTLRHLSGFHTDALDASLSPAATAIEAIRLAVDGAGNIFSIYAFDDIGTYSLSYKAEDLMIARFTADGKFVNKFVQTMNSCGIAVDNQSRIYISERNQIKIYSNNGELVDIMPGFSGINAFSLDNENNVYVLANDRVIKRAAINQ